MSIASRYYFSILHIQAAAVFSRQAAEIEAGYSGTDYDEIWTRDKGYVLGSVISSVAFLEAQINEVFCDADEGAIGLISNLPSAERDLLRDLWRLEVPRTARYAVLKKFDICLALLRRSPFEKGAKPYQDADNVVKLRNSLVHSEPQTTVHGSQGDGHNLEKKLADKFAVNRIVPASHPFWPDRCLGSGCAAWAVTAAVGFADEFFSRLGVSVPYEHVRGRLSPG
jgi:hypothetical protein